ncbi:MAG TPA: hypothetical protein VN449_07475 [Gaiellaceae bacterium]|nr:hypothetical protein [Gaiellaceae bacterium]
MTVLALAATIWAAVTGFYGTRNWAPIDVCKATYMGEDFALVQAKIRGARHIAALHFLNPKRGWVVMWADGRVNPKISPYTRSLVQAEVTRLKAKCLAP